MNSFVPFEWSGVSFTPSYAQLDSFTPFAHPCRHFRFHNSQSKWSTKPFHILTQLSLSGFSWHHSGLFNRRLLDQNQQWAKESLYGPGGDWIITGQTQNTFRPWTATSCPHPSAFIPCLKFSRDLVQVNKINKIRELEIISGKSQMN